MFIKSKRFKNDRRLKKRIRLRKSIRGDASKPRLSVFRSDHHTYAQLISDIDGRTLVSASTREKEVMEKVLSEEQEGAARSTKSVAAARAVGAILGQRAKSQEIVQVVFDRNGFIYHGRVQAVADGARTAGLKL